MTIWRGAACQVILMARPNSSGNRRIDLPSVFGPKSWSMVTGSSESLTGVLFLETGGLPEFHTLEDGSDGLTTVPGSWGIS